MIKMKKKQYAAKLKDSLLTNTRRFWSLVKSTTKQNRSSGFLRDGQHFVTNNKEKADLLNIFFQSVFSRNDGFFFFVNFYLNICIILKTKHYLQH